MRRRPGSRSSRERAADPSCCGSPNAGVCLDVFHFQTGPSKLEDLGGLTRENLAWVQLCDVSGTPRELAGDRDRILPGDGDFPLGPIVAHLGRIGYNGFVSLELFNPHLWEVAADRVADLGYRALCRVLGRAEADDTRSLPALVERTQIPD